jgi:hypothetical protein
MVPIILIPMPLPGNPVYPACLLDQIKKRSAIVTITTSGRRSQAYNPFEVISFFKFKI